MSLQLAGSYTLNSNNPKQLIQTSTGTYVVSLLSTGSGTIQTTVPIDITYSYDGNNYLVENSNQFLCLMAQGDPYTYNVLNSPSPSFSNGNFVQIANIDLTSNINPIMFDIFSGTYDGSNYALSNITIQEDFDTVANKRGLFSSLSNATIKNVKVAGATSVTDATNGTDYAGVDFGFIAGQASSSVIQDCIISGTITTLKCYGFGGIVQYASNCELLRNSFEVSGNVDMIDANGAGICGLSTDSKILFNTNNLEGSISSPSSNIGGIIGYSIDNDTIYGNINIMTGNLESSFDEINVGGIVGATSSNATIMVNINAMHGNIESGTAYNGGIVGSSTESTITNNINSMVGHIDGSGIVDTATNSTIQFNLNVMRGICAVSAATHTINDNSLESVSKNLVAMRGYSSSNEYDVNVASATTLYGFSNTYSIPTYTYALDVITNNDYYQYYNSFSNLPILKFSATDSVVIDETTYDGPAPYWVVSYPNIFDSNSYRYYMFAKSSIVSPVIATISTASFIKVKDDLVTTEISAFDIADVVSKLFSFAFEWNENSTVGGNVGLGTTLPTKKLDIVGDINFTGNLYHGGERLGVWLTNSSNIYYNTGNVGINTSTASYPLDVNGSVKALSFLQVSDMRLKENILDEQLGIDFVSSLQPKTFKFINGSSDRVYHGFIAQDILNTGITELVKADGKGMLSIDLNSLISPITKAIQDLYTENKILEDEITKLQQLTNKL